MTLFNQYPLPVYEVIELEAEEIVLASGDDDEI